MAVIDNIALLKNQIQQKFVKIAKRARIKFEDGKSAESEFCCLMRLHAVYIALCDLPAPTYDQLKEMEVLVNSICGRDRFVFKPMDWCSMDFENAGPNPDVPISACDIFYENPAYPGENSLCKVLDKIVDTLNYENPWIKFTIKEGLSAGRYEIGEISGFSTVETTVNKSALNFYDIDRNGDLVQYARELKNAIPDQVLNIDLQTGEPQIFLLKGKYFDLERYKNQNLKAETQLKWETVWPCYYGVGPLTALDNPATINAFVQSLQRNMYCDPCFRIDIPEGMVLYYFYPFSGMKKEFKSKNGVMRGSYKGTIDGIRTLSMDNFNIAGEKTYGIIRTDQPGIRFFEACVIDFEIEEIEMPIVPIVIPELAYPSAWSNVYCVKFEPMVTVDSTWADLVCIQESEPQPALDTFGSSLQVIGNDNVLTWFLQYVSPVVNPVSFSFTTLIKDSTNQTIASIVCTGSLIAGQVRYDSPSGETIITEAAGLTGLTREVIVNSLTIIND